MTVKQLVSMSASEHTPFLRHSMTQIHKIDFLIDTEVFFKSLIEGMEVLGPSTMTSFFLPR